MKRSGKYLLIGLDADQDVLVIHLGMSGQLLRVKSPKEPMAKHTHVVITFTQAGQLRFVDPRTFGELFVTRADELEKAVPELAHLGFDPVDDVMSWTRFGALLAHRHAQLKTLLMDQRFVAGIGNIYSDEILFAAGLRYDRASDSLSAQEVRRLYRGMVETLSEAIKHRGSSLADEQYRDLFGEVGDYPGTAPGLRPRGPGMSPLPPRDRASEGERAVFVHVRGLPGLSCQSSSRSGRGSGTVGITPGGARRPASSGAAPVRRPIPREQGRRPCCRCSRRGCRRVRRCASRQRSRPACRQAATGNAGRARRRGRPPWPVRVLATSSRSPGRRVGSMLVARHHEPPGPDPCQRRRSGP